MHHVAHGEGGVRAGGQPGRQEKTRSSNARRRLGDGGARKGNPCGGEMGIR